MENKISILGTFHGFHREMKNYSVQKLEQLLEASRPDVVLVEIRAEDVVKNDFTKSPWDMREIVIPFAKSKNIPFEPYDWWPDNLRDLYNQYYQEFRKTENGEVIFKKVDDEWAPFRKICPDPAEATYEFVHSKEFARLSKNFRSLVKDLVGEGPQNLMWTTRAERMNHNIEIILQQYQKKRITICTGAFHRPDVEDFLVDRKLY